MPNIFVVSSATAVGDVATIIGTVDTSPASGTPTPVTIQMNLSALIKANTSGGIAAVKAIVGPQMLAAAIAQNPVLAPPPAQIVQLPTGTFTQ